MSAEADAAIAILAATEGELAVLRERLADADALPLPGIDGAWRGRLSGRAVVLAAGGIGTAAAAASVATLAAHVAPAAVLMTGIAGAYVGAFVPVGAAVAASEEIDLDAGVARRDGLDSLASIPLARGHGPGGPVYDRVACDPAWRDALATACRTVPLPFASSDAISGDLDVAAERADRSGAALESMEGIGAAIACARLGVPFAELRGVSNVAGIRDKAAWDVRGAVRAASDALVQALRHGPSHG